MSRFLFSIIFFTCIASAPVYAGGEALASIQKRVENFQKRYHIPILYQNINIFGNLLSFQTVTSQEYRLLDKYLALFEEEINKYPPEFFSDREIRAIALVTHLFSGKKPAQGVYSSDARVMFFDILRFSNNKALMRHGIHHELFHMMAFQTPHYILDNPAWVKFNSGSFVYGNRDHAPLKVNPINPQAPGELGFVTDYAMTSVEEDKAEVFACLMQSMHKKLIMRWAEKDGVMRQKIQAIKGFVAGYCPQMSEAYWEKYVASDLD